MSNAFLDEIRKIPSFDVAIIGSVILNKAKSEVVINLITDKTYSEEDVVAAKKVMREFVPELFSCRFEVSKLTPDEKMVAKKIYDVIGETNRQIAALTEQSDIRVVKTERGFNFEIELLQVDEHTNDFIKSISDKLSKCYCGEFNGKYVASRKSLDDIEVEETPDIIEYEIPIRYFDITNFSYLEGTQKQKSAVYIADLNFVSDNVVICGKIQDIRDKVITTSSGKERLMYHFVIHDGTAAIRATYFPRQKTIEQRKKLKDGDSVVLTCKTELYRDMVSVTANYIDYGKPPENFVPEKRASKPVPEYYRTVFPEKYVDFNQANLFADTSLPECLTQNTFVVFDLETTGLSSSPSSGNMDRIIEIGAYKIIGGEIKESFSTFVNPCRRLSAEIIGLTGIDQQTVDKAPIFEKVMPDFFKFISGCYLVGHNVANFDYKFIDYYCAACGYSTERKLFDTLSLSQQILRLSNYKLNTVADYFGITFNHHRAIDDALATAKIFIELIKLKKSLPTTC